MAARGILEQLTGYKLDVNPLDALLMCVRIAAAEVSFFTAKISELEPDDVIGRPMREQVASTKDTWGVVDLKLPYELNIWIRARSAAVDNLAKYSALAIKAGVEERLIQVAERTGDRLAAAIEGILNQLQLTPDQMRRAPEAIRAQLYLLEGGRAA